MAKNHKNACPALYWFMAWGLLYFLARMEKTKEAKLEPGVERRWLWRMPGVDY